jgi:hypothetical protein
MGFQKSPSSPFRVCNHYKWMKHNRRNLNTRARIMKPCNSNTPTPLIGAVARALSNLAGQAASALLRVSKRVILDSESAQDSDGG